MYDSNKDELIEAQKQVIGILFEVIKRFQANNNLDEEYFEIVSIENKTEDDKKRIQNIMNQRTENSEIIGRLLKQLEI
jgi:hypothetical protein